MNKKQDITFRLVSYTDAAGKYSPDAYRSGNEDNFYVDDDLTDNTTNCGAQDEIIHLGKLGMLMVVADGMGGMNAGEVASQIAIDTVRDSFTTDKLSDADTSTVLSRQKYLEQAIRQADKNIKADARKNRSREGMGSTIIMAWLYNDELTISWCGDSRAYIYNAKSGIRLISQDHSYVQELVNKGMLTYDQTFDHPQNNIITRSLGDPTKEAKPESKTLKVGKGDIILLCSDGLSGVLRDRKTYDEKGQLYPEENLEDIIRDHTSSMKECREALWEAAERGGWYDNVTAILCQITEGPESKWGTVLPVPSVSNDNRKKKKLGLYAIIGLFVVLAVIGAFFIGRGFGGSSTEGAETTDSTSVENTDTTSVVNDTVKKEETAPNEVEEKDENTATRPSFQEQVKQKVEEDAAVAEEANQNVLTPISKEGDKSSKTNGKLTPIQDKFKQDKSDNPIALTALKKNKTDNPINNPQQ